MTSLLSQGSYGCIFYPGISCEGKKYSSKSYVTKLQRKGYSSQNETDIGKKIRKLGDYQLFFVPVLSTCPIKLSAIKSKELKDCNIAYDKESDYVLMRLGYIESVPFFSYITNISDKKQFLFSNTVSSFMHLLNGIQKLNDLNLVQFDLKPTNILYNADNNLPLIIDFGISLDMSKYKHSEIRNYFYTYVPSYYIWPYDVHIICLISTKYVGTSDTITENDIVTLTKSYVDFNKALEIFSDEFREKFKKKCSSYGKRFIGKSIEWCLKELIVDKNYRTWDNYALCILYLRFISYLFHRGFGKSNFIIKLTQLLLTNISPDPSDRLSIINTISGVNQFFNSKMTADEMASLINTMDIKPQEVQKSIAKDKLERIER